MYLSRIELDYKRRTTMQALAQPSRLHGAIERCFEGERKRRLWRIDNLLSAVYLLLLSEDKPDFQNLWEQFGDKDKHGVWETKSYESFLEKIAAGQQRRFRLSANPVRSVKTIEEKRGKIYAHMTPKYQKEWLADRAGKHGFMIEDDYFEVVRSEWVNFVKINTTKKVSILTVDFEGVLQITDADLFRKTLVDGVGRAKAYGCGLLTVVRV